MKHPSPSHRPVLPRYHGRALAAAYSETFPRGMHKRNQQMAQAGCELFMLLVRGGFGGDWHTSWFWRDDGVYGDESDRTDGLTLDDQARAILEARPDAVFMVRWGSEVPGTWARRHPEECQASTVRRLDRSSYASRLALEGRMELARRIVRWCESMPWGERVVGYMAFGQDEGTHDLSFEALFDQSGAARREFRAWLRKAYGTDAALREAWGDPTVAIDTALPPTDEEWRRDLSGWHHWPRPEQSRRHRDYFEMYRGLLRLQRTAELSAIREAATRPVLTATDALKQPMMGWLIMDAFRAEARGMAFQNILLASGSIGVGEILDDPSLDALITPADYTARSVGFGWDAEGIADSLVLRGKTIFIEDDARSWATDERRTQGAWRNVAECRAGLLRNLALAASRGAFPYWMNVGGGYFDDPDVLRVVAEQIPVRRTLLTRPRVETEHAIAMIIDDMSPLDENFTSGFQNLAVLRQRNDHLCMTGLPWRVYLLSDLARDEFPAYRCYLLPNLFRLTPEKEALIRRKLFRGGSVAVFGPGTAISDGRALGSTGTSRLLGFAIEFEDKESARRVLAYGRSHPALAEVSPSTTYGDSFVYGPLLCPASDLSGSGAVELGKASTWWESNCAGLVLKEFGLGAAGNGRSGPRGDGDYAVVFSVATPLPAALLRSLALYGGCTPWSDLGDVVAANGSMLAVHTMTPGTRTLRLPHAAAAVDAVTGEVVGRAGTVFEIELGAPDTRVFLLEEE